MAIIPPDREAILKSVQALSPDEQLELAREIMHGYMEATVHQTPPASWVSWRELAGITLAPGQASPTDEQVERWLDERRMAREA